MSEHILSWDEWVDAFSPIEELNSPSELQGFMVGCLTALQAPTATQWECLLAQLDVVLDKPHQMALIILQAQHIDAALDADHMDLLLMLPEEHSPLTVRINALIDWCAGLLFGFGLSGASLRAGEDEMIEDISAISSTDQLKIDDDAQIDDDDFEELVEFARMIPISLALGRDKMPVDQFIKQAKLQLPKLAVDLTEDIH